MILWCSDWSPAYISCFKCLCNLLATFKGRELVFNFIEKVLQYIFFQPRVNYMSCEWNCAYFYFMYFSTFLYITVSYICVYFFHQRNRIYEKRGGSFKATWRERSEVCRTAENTSGKSKAVLIFWNKLLHSWRVVSHFWILILADFRAWK